MKAFVDKLLDKLKLETTMQGFLRNLIKTALNFIVLCIVADSIGIPIASVLAVIGMLGLAVSLSVQGALSNVANGFMILINKPFKVDDYVSVSGIEGFVKEIGMLCTKVLTIDNKLIIVPNSEVMGGKITNFGHITCGTNKNAADAYNCEMINGCYWHYTGNAGIGKLTMLKNSRLDVDGKAEFTQSWQNLDAKCNDCESEYSDG